MQIEIYSLTANEKQISIDLVAICDSFSSLLWDVEYYQCGSFEVYIAANPQNVEIFQLGRIVGRDDDSEHFGIIESMKIETDSEDGDYLTVSGRFLTCLLERRIIYPSFWQEIHTRIWFGVCYHEMPFLPESAIYQDFPWVRSAVTAGRAKQDYRSAMII